MMIDRKRIKEAFPKKAWAFVERYDAVIIGKWNGNIEEIEFFETIGKKVEKRVLDEVGTNVLRVFDGKRELKFTGEKCRDTADYDSKAYIDKLANAKYYMYGEKHEKKVDYTKLSEERGGIIYFPAELDFPKNKINLLLGIRNYVKFNPVPVLEKKSDDYTTGLGTNGAGALEVVDYAYTGFYYANREAVEL